MLSRPDLGLPAPQTWSLPLPVTAPHPTLPTIPIPPSDPPVWLFRLQSIYSHIFWSLLIPFLLHHTLTPSSVHFNLLHSHPPLLPMATRPQPSSVISPPRASLQLSEIPGCCRPSRHRSSKDRISLPRLWRLLHYSGRSWCKG